MHKIFMRYRYTVHFYFVPLLKIKTQIQRTTQPDGVSEAPAGSCNECESMNDTSGNMAISFAADSEGCCGTEAINELAPKASPALAFAEPLVLLLASSKPNPAMVCINTNA